MDYDSHCPGGILGYCAGRCARCPLRSTGRGSSPAVFHHYSVHNRVYHQLSDKVQDEDFHQDTINNRDGNVYHGEYTSSDNDAKGKDLSSHGDYHDDIVSHINPNNQRACFYKIVSLIQVSLYSAGVVWW